MRVLLTLPREDFLRSKRDVVMHKDGIIRFVQVSPFEVLTLREWCQRNELRYTTYRYRWMVRFGDVRLLQEKEAKKLSKKLAETDGGKGGDHRSVEYRKKRGKTDFSKVKPINWDW